MVRYGGNFSDMKVVSLLIFWSLSFLQAGEHGRLLSAGCVDRQLTKAEFESAVIQKTRDASSPANPSSNSLGGSLWDDEDSLEDVFFDTGFSLAGSLLIRVRDSLSALARGQHDFFRTPSHNHPLRC
jgi:hypothetical protein